MLYGHQILGCYCGDYENRFLLGCEVVYDSMRT